MPPPLAIVESCKYDFSVIATVLAMKFAFHMPTYREQNWFAQCGWFPSRSTTNDLINYGVDDDRPLVPADVVPAAIPVDPPGRRHAACVSCCGTPLDEEQSAQLDDRSRSRAARRPATPDLPDRPPATLGCTRAWTAWPRTMFFTGR